MRKLLLVLAVIVGFGSPASANWTARDANNNIITFFNTNNCTSVVCVPVAEPVDASGAAFGTASNPFYMNFSTGAQLPGFSSPPSFKLQDGSGNSIGSTEGALNVNITGGASGGGDVNLTEILGAAPSATNPLWVAPETGASWAVAGTFWPYTLGQQVAGSSVPVVLPAAQITALTPPAAITGYALESGGNLANLYGAVGSGASPAANTLQARLAAIVTALGSPAQAGAATPAGGNVVGSVASLSTNVSLTVTPTVAASSHAVGAAIGGLQTMAFFRASPSSPAPASPFSGLINNVKWTWKTGSNLTAVTVYLFSANPSSSTCTDASAFSLNAADVSKLVAGSPFVLTPAVIGSGSTISAAYSQSPISVKNSDGTPGQDIYACVVADATITPAANDGILTVAGITD